MKRPPSGHSTRSAPTTEVSPNEAYPGLVNVIVMQQVTKLYGATRALDGMDLEVGEGRVHGLLGPNGAGKSTTLSVLLGLSRATSGTVRVFGWDPVTHGQEVRSRTATVPSDVRLWPTLTGGDVIETIAGLRNDCSPLRRREFLERFELDPRVRCRDYSSGNRQKVLLVAALQARADLYVFDEPTNGLDPLVDETFRQVVREERARGATVVLSSHILADVDNLADDVTLMRRGRRVDGGTLESLRHVTLLRVRAKVDPVYDGSLVEAGVGDFTRDGEWCVGSVDPESLSRVLGALSVASPHDVRVDPPSLEAVFRHYYSDESP